MAISEITVEQLHGLLAADESIRLVDVREDDEWANSHIGRATHVVLGTMSEHLDAFGPDGAEHPTYVMCKVGGRSFRACEYAEAQGKHVVNVAGGMMAWWASGLDTVTGA
ncbi:MAG: rhodanese-like domain-containing protein [Actinomycetota bacterium]|uniref:rhodanese-like domain-containing protein n=1 Tax=uncultured Ilumatobacter sp. TaxID=879968 RepID=UPI00374E5AA6|nr:rhodanese-like domain-containing protein [Actinomycetota bacterium]